MTKRLTQEFVEIELAKKGYKLIGKYVNSSTKIILQDEEGFLYVTIWDSFKQGCEPWMVSPNNPYSIQNIQHYLDLNLKEYKLLSTEYKSVKSELEFMCDKGHKFTSTWDKISHGYRCSVCNCIATTDSWMIPYFKNKEDAYNYSHGSNGKVFVVCPYCGREKEMMISNIYRYKGIGCTCGDGTSYPNKFIYSAMIQIFGIDNVFTEQRFDWSDNKIYDILIKTQNGDNILIENHGRQHYEQTGRKGKRARTLQEEQNNDKYKKQLALDNNINYYIELDCRYSELEYIKNSILNSELSEIIDLSNIDWIKCEEYAINSNKVKEVCDYWHLHNEVNNEELTTTDISKVFNLGKSTIRIYLKQGNILGWCNYNPKEELKKTTSKNNKSTGKPVEIFKDSKSLGIFENCHELERRSEDLFGVKLLNNAISRVCNGKQSHHHSFTFSYITKEEYNKRKQNI